MVKLSSLAKTGAWSAILQWSRLGLNAIVFLVLSRWLTLAEIGAVAAAQAPVLFIQQVLSAVVADAVVQENDASDERLSTLFWISTGIGALCSLFLLAVAPLLAWAIGHAEVAIFTLALAPIPLLLSLGGVLDGLLRKRLHTRQLAIRTALATGLAGGITLFLGYIGYGAWALVVFYVANVTFATALLFVIEKWRPRRMIARSYVPEIGATLLALTGRYAISAASLPLIQLLISGSLGVVAGGTFQVAQRVYALVDSITVTPMRFLALPLFARVQGQRAQVGRQMLKALSVAGLIGVPAYLGTVAVAADVLPLLVGERNGIPAVPVLQVLCLYGPASLVVNLVNNALTSCGLSVVVFRRAALVFLLTLVPCAVAAQFSVLAVAWAYSAIGGGSGVLLGLLLAQRLLDARWGKMLGAVLLPLIAGAVMTAGVFTLAVVMPPMSPVLRIAILAATGALIYLLAILVVARPHLRTLLKVAFGKSGSS